MRILAVDRPHRDNPRTMTNTLTRNRKADRRKICERQVAENGLGRRIQELIAQNYASYTDLARVLGVDPRTVRDRILQDRMFACDLPVLAEALDVTVDYLLFGTDDLQTLSGIARRACSSSESAVETLSSLLDEVRAALDQARKLALESNQAANKVVRALEMQMEAAQEPVAAG